MTDSSTNGFLIVALGASAGGLEPLESFFRHMPSDAGIAFVIVQHLAPNHPTALPELLARHTGMPVEQAEDKAAVVPDRVYVIPPNATLTISDGVLNVTPPVEARGRRAPIDSLFSSLAEDRGENAVCIMLSGTGTDGTLGLSAIKEYGGMAMAQTLESARYDSILRSAISTGLVDYVLPVEEMPAKLLEYAAHLKSVNGNGRENCVRDQIGAHMGKIHEALRRRSGHDFSRYKESTIARRLERRMKALQIETVEQYVHVLDEQPEEAGQLFKDLLIGVTQFFRDPAAFEALGREVIPKLFEGKEPGGEIRVCVVGCASGEEAYSIAILLCEHVSTLDRAPKVKIFATDIDERGLDTARKGLYPESIAQHVSPERLARFFTRQDSAYQVKRELREICIFSLHSFIKDPPFSRLDLISCRNVMIYLGPELQRKIVPLLHYALRTGGYLFLGPSESASAYPELFRAVDKKNRIFQGKKRLSYADVAFPVGNIRRLEQAGGNRPIPEEQNLPKQLERVILQRYRPACVTVNENGDAVYFSGRISRYLEQPTGRPDPNVINMAREGLRIPLRTALHQAVNTGQSVVQKQVSVRINGGVSHVDLTVEPLAEFRTANLYMIVFEDSIAGSGSQQAVAPASDASAEETIRHLEDELRSAIERAQTMFEELESSNEELKSANEEYQSTNEELETSKEELQSFNEELQTVNNEVNRKAAELDHANSDLRNLLNSTEIATIFLDRELRIRNFTPSAGAVFRLIAGDVGRPITDLASQLNGIDLMTDATEVLGTLATIKRQLTSSGGQHFQMRVMPYRTVNNVIDGVVLTFTDITEIKEAEELIRSIVDTVREPLLVLDGNLRVVSASRAFYGTFHVSAEQTLASSFYDLGNRQWDIPDLRRLLGKVLPENKTIEDFRVKYDLPGVGRRTMLLNARQVQQQAGREPLILLAIEDATARTRLLEGRLGQLSAIVQSSQDAIISSDVSGIIRTWNQGAERLFGYQAEEIIGKSVSILAGPGHQDEIPNVLARLCRGERVEHYVTERRAKDGRTIPVSLSVSSIVGISGEVIGVSKIVRDITRQKLAEESLRRSEELLAMELAATQRFQETSTQLIQEGSEEVLYAKIVDAGVAIMRSDMASMQVRDEDEDALRMVAYRGFEPEFGKIFGLNRPDTRTSCSAAMREGRRVVVPDVETCDFITDTPALDDHRRMGIRAVQSTPLVARGGKLLGVLSTHWRNPHQPAERELRLFDVLARQAADLIERSQADRALRESEERFRTLVSGLADVTWTANAEGRFITTPPAWSAYTGQNWEEMKDFGWNDAWHPEDRASILRIWERARMARSLFQSQGRIWHAATRQHRYFEARAVPLFNQDGSVREWVGTCTDVDDKRRSEEQLRRAAEFDEAVMANMGEGLYTVDAGGHVTSMNPAAEKLFGWTFEELRGKKMHDATHHHHPDGTPFPSEDCAGLLVLRDATTLIDREDIFIRKDGTFFDVVYSSAPLRSGAEIVGLVVVFRDVSDRKQAEAAAREASERLRFMAESMPQKIFTATPNGDLDYFNRQWTDFSGLAFEQLRKGWTQFVHPDDVAENRRIWQHSVETGEPFQFVHRFHRADGLYRWHLSRAHAMRDAGGKISMWIGSNTEIHEEKEREEQLQRANEDLNQFAFAASHDFQEPLRMITSYSQLLLSGYRGQLDEEASVCVRFITEGTQRMRELLADLLSFTGLGSAEQHSIEPVDLNDIFQRVLQNLNLAIAESGAVVDSDRLPEVQGQPAHFLQLFQNLIDNAIKYRGEKIPSVHVSVEERTDEWLLAVTDNGIGIEPEFHRQIFGVFKRLHGRSIPGTGIGLAICKRVVERYGGRIWIESKLGQGSTFYFTLPLGR